MKTQEEIYQKVASVLEDLFEIDPELISADAQSLRRPGYRQALTR